MRERNRNWARNWNHMGWGNFFEGCAAHYTSLGLAARCRGRATWSGAGAAGGWGCVAAGQTGLRGCCLDYTRHKAAQGCAWLHGAGAGLLLVAVEAWAAGGGC
ncbi:hypothetical protein Acr_15g0019480 [Actinidia rufa]|uniref:Uncharacterized protein n=1 Tax=Actinidia rufa TaxID=165716 RepID=A0A7J0FYU6_9ERIC|nr:hypothetical protein Acr_15g0019480 [Actinidia rufa]